MDHLRVCLFYYFEVLADLHHRGVGKISEIGRGATSSL